MFHLDRNLHMMTCTYTFPPIFSFLLGGGVSVFVFAASSSSSSSINDDIIGWEEEGEEEEERGFDGGVGVGVCATQHVMAEDAFNFVYSHTDTTILCMMLAYTVL